MFHPRRESAPQRKEAETQTPDVNRKRDAVQETQGGLLVMRAWRRRGGFPAGRRDLPKETKSGPREICRSSQTSTSSLPTERLCVRYVCGGKGGGEGREG